MKRRSAIIAIVAGAVGLCALIVIGALTSRAPVFEPSGGEITLNRDTVVVDDVPVEIFIGVHTARRAVLQIAAPDATSADLTELIGQPHLVTDTGVLTPDVTTRTLADGTPTLSLEFRHPRSIGTATFVFTADKEYTFECKWPNA